MSGKGGCIRNGPADPDQPALQYMRRPRWQLDKMKDFTLRQMLYVVSGDGNRFYSFLLFLDAHGLLDDALPVVEELNKPSNGDVYKIDIIEGPETEEPHGSQDQRTTQ